MIELLADDLSLWHFYCYTCYPEYGVVALVFPLHFVPALGCWTLILDDPGALVRGTPRELCWKAETKGIICKHR